MKVLNWAIASHIRPLPDIKPRPGLKVAVITTFVPASESAGLLEKTLPALINVEYPHDTWLLDEGDDPEAKRLCEKYGVNHFSRKGLDRYNQKEGKFAVRTKGGNHNSWYDTVGNDYDIVAQMDTDFIADKQFLTKTLGYFSDPKVAFVGTPQVYGNDKESLIARGAAQQTYSFYGPMLRGMHGMKGTTLLIGANHVIRVAALKSVDHYSAHITEDLLTGMKLHAKGWRSVYVPEVLAIGEGPTAWKAYFAQQKRWAYGCMHVLFHHSFKLFKNMEGRRIIYYYLIQQHYFSGVAMALSVLCLSLYFIFGVQTADVDLLHFLGFYGPMFVVCGLMSFWLQRFNIRPKKERGIMWSGMFVGIAAWPIFFTGFLSLFKKHGLAYQVTPKGGKVKVPRRLPLGLFVPHFTLGTLALAGFLSGVITGKHNPIMLFWSVVTAFLMFLVPITLPIISGVATSIYGLRRFFVNLNNQYKVLEFSTVDRGLLPNPPTDDEKYSYVKRGVNFLMPFSIISFFCLTVSVASFLLSHLVLWPLLIMLFISVVYFGISLIVDSFTKGFDVEAHKRLVAGWKPDRYPTIDVFLPTAGESLEVLRNTWLGVRAMGLAYPGEVRAYCLDDSDRESVRDMADEFGFNYEVRENRGWFKKAGNLRHGFKVSQGDVIVIFDAAFVPRKDFLAEMMPYFYKNPNIAIVQSPQYFNVSSAQNWLERGAGAVQELFYRYSQVSRQNHDASICVGSNAIYRRIALETIGGTALIEHSEDVHTGVNLRAKGWTLQYIPVVLAKGLCPSDMRSFFKQQYRWCMGSMSLLGSAKFWNVKMGFRTRLSYISGFIYYIHTGLTAFYAPVIPIILLTLLPQHISVINYLLIFPAFIFTQLIYPLWHNATYGVEAWSTRLVYSWAHLFAISDAVTNKPMGWQPTGTKAVKDLRYTAFRCLQILFNFIPGLLWTGLAAYDMVTIDYFNYLPIFVSGLYYLLICAKVTLYFSKSVSLHTPSSQRRARFSKWVPRLAR
ncbi:MAG TPA: glycosyltransferase [Candidatus Saccharimonadales bacterium]|nr:glycosyltransferase [Candidatus Saccharimonadales bacterium]